MNPGHRSGRRRAIGRLVAVALAALLPPRMTRAAAAGSEARFNVDVPAGQWKGLRVKNLPKGTSLAIEAQSSGALRILVLDEEDLRRMPAPERPLFEGGLETRLSFSMEIPRSGHYYVILDNRGRNAPRKVQLIVRAKPPAPPPPEKRAGNQVSGSGRQTPAAA